VGFWSELGEALGLRERTSGRTRHAPRGGRTRTAHPTRMQTREKYGPEGKAARTRVQLADRRDNQPKPFRGQAAVEPKLRQRNARAPGARASVAARNFWQGESFASRVRDQPAEVWWRGSGR